MIDNGKMQDPVQHQGHGANGVTTNSQESLEQRVHRLEDVIAALQDTQPLEDRIVERVSGRVHRNSPSPRDSAGILIEAGRRLLPTAVGIVRAQTENVQPQAAAVKNQPPSQPSNAQHAWLLMEIYSEVCSIVRMFRDVNYLRNCLTLMIPAGALLVLLMTSWIWLPGSLLFPSFVAIPYVKLIDLVLAFFLFKLISRAAQKHRESTPRLPRL